MPVVINEANVSYKLLLLISSNVSVERMSKYLLYPDLRSWQRAKV